MRFCFNAAESILEFPERLAVCDWVAVLPCLVIPPKSSSHVTGRMFGDGIYASDISSKALNYSVGYWGGKRDHRVFMFVLDMAMGREYIPSGYNGKRYPPKGYDSTFAKSGKSGVINNEMIVYNLNQVNLTYLLELE